MDPAAYWRLLDTSHAVEVRLPDRRGADWWGLEHVLLDVEDHKVWPVTWLRGPSVLTLLASGRPPRPTGSLGRRLRDRRNRP